MKRQPRHLVTNFDGVVVDADDAPSGSPSELAGRRCRDVVAALTPKGRPVCTDDCVQKLDEPCDHGVVRTREGAARLRCIPVGEHRVVRIEPLDAEALGLKPLSPRELEILQLVARGMTNARIARQLNRSTSTVGTHLEHILEKLRVRSRAEAVARAQELGLLSH
ncbi:MAG: DNA-binding response regulator [Deltaproteobacteria bacterium]|nr:MAG: DNA-binding response regulator [Deltaproteobacteria bacterium]